MFTCKKTLVYQENERLGEVEIYPYESPPQYRRDFDGEEPKRMKIIDEVMKKEFRISHFSQKSERCPPLAVLHTITSTGICFKMESKTSLSQDMPLHVLHSSCIRDNKTAVMVLGAEELHLVAMYSRKNDKQHPCFWVFNVVSGLYNSCLDMLNLRCLGIVFDLDETLVVANTMRSFEDRIDGLQRKISSEVDPQRIAGMVAEVKRYQDDKNILKQYIDSDQVFDNGKVIKVQSEVVNALSDNHQPFVRPIIRLQEKNIILTRINPQIRDTSVLVRLRPAWEELRGYLIAKGRKRFEVYVCTMAERDYALEMWRLLDPDSNLITTNELLNRIVCVKSGVKKSLVNVFHNGVCDPKMALVIDDRLKVWEENDQPRVHVVPAFAPYYAPQAEANNTIPVLLVARHVASNVRAGFFKDFDDSLLPRTLEISYEDDMRDIHSPPDVSNYLVSEDDTSASNGNKDQLSFDGMADAEVGRRLKEALSAPAQVSSAMNNLDPRIVATLKAMASSSGVASSQPSVAPFTMQFPQASSVSPLVSANISEPNLQNSPAREEGEVPESELDPDTRRRLLILQHGQDTNDCLPSKPPAQVPPQHVKSRGGWFPVDEEMSPQLNRPGSKELPLDSETIHLEKPRPRRGFFPKFEGPIPSDRSGHENQRLQRLRLNNTQPGYNSFSGEEMPLSRSYSRTRDVEFESGRDVQDAESPVAVLQDIAMRCGAKVEFRPAILPSLELQFSTEVWFAEKKVGEGIGKTIRTAKQQAAESCIKTLADIYISGSKPDSRSAHGDANGSMSNFHSLVQREGPSFFSNSADISRPVDPRVDASRKSVGPVSALRDLCTMEGLDVVYQTRSSPSGPKDEVHAQVEIDGQVLGKGVGLTWDEAKAQAADRALVSLRSMLGPISHKRQGSPRSMHGMSNKRLKPEFPRFVQRMPSSGRYPKNTPPVP